MIIDLRFFQLVPLIILALFVIEFQFELFSKIIAKVRRSEHG